MLETPYFSCEDLSLDLGGREVLRNISLELREGEVLGIIGPNGAGKTSLLEILSGRYRPKTGKVYFEGRDINRLSLFERARLGIGRHRHPAPAHWLKRLVPLVLSNVAPHVGVRSVRVLRCS